MQSISNCPSITYLFKEKWTFQKKNASKLEILITQDRVAFTIFDLENDLIIINADSEGQKGNHIAIPETIKCDDIRQMFLTKRNSKDTYEYGYIHFEECIIDFCFDEHNSNIFVMVKSGDISRIDVSKLMHRIYSSGDGAHTMQVGTKTDVFLDLLQPRTYISNANDPLQYAKDLTDLKTHFLSLPGGLALKCISSYVYIISLYDDSISLLVSSIEAGQNQTTVSGNTCSYQLLKNMFLKNDVTISQLYLISSTSTPNSVALDKSLFKELFGDNAVLQASNILIFGLQDGNIYSIPIGSICSVCHPKILCDLKQSLKYLSNLSIAVIKHDILHVTIYEQSAKTKVEESVKSCQDSLSDNNCLLLLGNHGKMFFAFNQQNDSGQLLFESQLSSSIVACTSDKDLVIVSDHSMIFVYKIIIKLQLGKQLAFNAKDIQDSIKFIPEHLLLQSIPLFYIQSIVVLKVQPLNLCCINKEKRVMKVAVPNVSHETDELSVHHDNLETLIKKLESINLQLDQVKEMSQEKNSILSQLRIATSLCYKVKRQKGVYKDVIPPVDVEITFQHICHESRQKLLVNGNMINNTNLPLLNGWSLTVKYYKKHHDSVSTDDIMHTMCSSENFIISSIKQKGSFQFSFLVGPSMLTFSTITIEFYLNFAFNKLINQDAVKLEAGVASFHVNSAVIDIIDMCQVSESGINPVLPYASISCDIPKRALFIKRTQQSNVLDAFLQQDAFQFMLNVTEEMILYLQQMFKIEHEATLTCQKVAKLVFTFLLKRKFESDQWYSSATTLMHINGEELEMNIREIKEDGNNRFMLVITSNNLSFMAAIHLHILVKFKNHLKNDRQNKDTIDNVLKELKDLQSRNEELQDSLYGCISAADKKKEIMSELLEMYTKLRKSWGHGDV